MNCLRRILPITIRIEIKRFLHLFRLLNDRRPFTKRSTVKPEKEHFPYILSERISRVEKNVPDHLAYLQKNKRKSLEIACKALNHLPVLPGEYFSLWRILGRPSRFKGYTKGFEIQNGKLVRNTAGGLCQIANALCWNALCAGMTIIERHRHDLDLFPDDHRDVPFGSGATVVYNYKDFIFFNPLKVPVLIEAYLDDTSLHVRFLSPEKAPSHIQIQERNAVIEKKGLITIRKNEIWRIITDNNQSSEELIFRNEAQVRYEIQLG